MQLDEQALARVQIDVLASLARGVRVEHNRKGGGAGRKLRLDNLVARRKLIDEARTRWRKEQATDAAHHLATEYLVGDRPEEGRG